MIDEQPTHSRHAVYYPAPSRRRGCACLGRLFLGLLLLITLATVAILAAAGALIYADYAREIEDGVAALDQARTRETFETTRIFDRHGQLLWEIFGEGKRTKVPLAAIPPAMIQATIAVEDDTFYDNIGLDAPSLLAALIANLRRPEERPVGGSTITQQLVRHIAFDYDERTAVSYSRKSKEIVLAWMMNRRYSKDEILTLYLNEIYYGNLAYGVEAAAQTYFSKPAVELTLAEASLLAALPQSPANLDPLTNREEARNRQWLVLTLMVQEGYISRAEAEAAYLVDLEFAPQEVSLQAPHFAVYVRQQLEAQFGADQVANGGLRVTTTLDLKYQRLAEFLARQHAQAIDPAHNLTNAALVALKPGTGEVLAMLGSIDYHDEAIDGRVNVALTLQQPGSAIKPITYAAALQPDPATGEPIRSAADILWDVPVAYPQFDGTEYRPLNYDRRFHGPVRVRQALANSYNVPAVLVLQELGLPRFLDLARQMGLWSLDGDPGQYGLSLTLGGAEVTPLELATAYGVLANGGFRVDPVTILHVSRANGDVLYEAPGALPAPVLDPRVAYLISDILDDDQARIPAMGRTNPLALPFPAAVKTGTSDDFRDNWTVGYTPGLVVAVWAGNSDNSPMIDISGLTGAAPLWAAYMEAVYGNYDLLDTLADGGAQPPTGFVRPDGLEERPLCDLGSIRPETTDCRWAGSELFLAAAPASLVDTPDPARVTWEVLEPAVVRAPAAPLPPDTVEIRLRLGNREVLLPPPGHCTVPAGVDMASLPPQALPQVFLQPPRNQESLPAAYQWAAEQGLALLPLQTCTSEILAQAGAGPANTIWRITSPRHGDTVRGVLPIIGTASFDSGQVQFYKIELGRGDLDHPEWLTLGQTRTQPVVNGQLETLYASGLPAGDYLLRLILVGWDGNYVGEPYTIRITIES